MEALSLLFYFVYIFVFLRPSYNWPGTCSVAEDGLESWPSRSHLLGSGVPGVHLHTQLAPGPLLSPAPLLRYLSFLLPISAATEGHLCVS